jgi:hypothetical protein
MSSVQTARLWGRGRFHKSKEHEVSASSWQLDSGFHLCRDFSYQGNGLHALLVAFKFRVYDLRINPLAICAQHGDLVGKEIEVFHLKVVGGAGALKEQTPSGVIQFRKSCQECCLWRPI